MAYLSSLSTPRVGLTALLSRPAAAGVARRSRGWNMEHPHILGLSEWRSIAQGAWPWSGKLASSR